MSLRAADPRSRIASSARPPILPLPRAKAPTRAHAVGHSRFSRQGLPHTLYRASLYISVCLLLLGERAAVSSRAETRKCCWRRSTTSSTRSCSASGRRGRATSPSSRRRRSCSCVLGGPASLTSQALLALAISVSRVLTVKNEFLSIPRPYQPITREDVPKVRPCAWNSAHCTGGPHAHLDRVQPLLHHRAHRPATTTAARRMVRSRCRRQRLPLSRRDPQVVRQHQCVDVSQPI